MKAVLVLEDGTVVEGRGFGAECKAWGEIVFASGMSGYVESLTDPSYAGQILMFTYPLIGNYGVTEEDYESEGIKVEGIVVREVCDRPSNWRSQKSLKEFALEFKTPGICGIDTRRLTRKIRTHGTMKSVLQTFAEGERVNLEGLKREAKEQKGISELNLVERVTTIGAKRVESRELRVRGTKVWGLPTANCYLYLPAGIRRRTSDSGYEVVLVDCGAKRSITENLLRRGMNVTILPFNASAEEILGYDPDAVLISNGPGDPAVVKETIAEVRKLIGKTVLYGICLGHQLISLALGARTYKLKFGHRGLNQPVKDLETGRVFISTQNHGFAVAEEDLANIGLEVTHINLNDNTIEGLKHKELPIRTAQYHPEAGPGPHDAYFFFDSLIDDISRRQ